MLQDKGILITGAGQGLGRSYALACADHGAGVVVNDIDGAAAEAVVEEIRLRGGRAIAARGSVGDWDQASTAVQRCIDAFGTCDGLVNNAARFHTSAPWDEDSRRLRSIVEVNVLGALYCGTHAMRLMREQRAGAIVNIVSGAQLGIAGMSAYGATKGAVNAMTLNWALEGAPYGIRVNALSPLAQTRITPQDGRGDRPAPESVAPLVVALLSDEITVTGQIFRFDGLRLSVYQPMRLCDEACVEEWNAARLAAAVDGLLVT